MSSSHFKVLKSLIGDLSKVTALITPIVIAFNDPNNPNNPDNVARQPLQVKKERKARLSSSTASTAADDGVAQLNEREHVIVKKCGSLFGLQPGPSALSVSLSLSVCVCWLVL